jgi:hypothetical protein
MLHKRSIVAGSALVVCLSPLAAATAAARVPEDRRTPAAVVPHDPPVREYYNYPEYEQVPVSAATASNPSDDTTVIALLAAGSALAGAGLALGGVHLYQRQQRRAVGSA